MAQTDNIGQIQSSALAKQVLPKLDFTYDTPTADYFQNNVSSMLKDGTGAATGLGSEVPGYLKSDIGTVPGLNTGEDLGLGDWFSQNKSMIGAGIGLGQLGLGYLNYSANKKGLESDLASAEQARRLNEEAAQNKRTIQDKAQSALRFA